MQKCTALLVQKDELKDAAHVLFVGKQLPTMQLLRGRPFGSALKHTISDMLDHAAVTRKWTCSSHPQGNAHMPERQRQWVAVPHLTKQGRQLKLQTSPACSTARLPTRGRQLRNQHHHHCLHLVFFLVLPRPIYVSVLACLLA